MENILTQKLFFEQIDKKNALILSEISPSINGQYNFYKDISFGDQGNEFVKNFLVYQGMKFVCFNHDEKYDILMNYNDKQITFEVKTDSYCGDKAKDKGNIAIEIECRGKTSGLQTTQSDYYMYYMPKIQELWRIKTSHLKTLIDNNNFYISENGGDLGSKTKNVLIPREKNKGHFKRYSFKSFPPTILK